MSGHSRATTAFLIVVTLLWALSGFVCVPHEPVLAESVSTITPSVLVSPSMVASPVSKSVVVTATPSVAPTVRATVTPKPKSSVAPTKAPTPQVTATSAPEVTSTPTPTATPAISPTPQTVVMYRIESPNGVLTGEGNYAGLSVGEVTKQIAAKHGTTFAYETPSMGWFVTELAGVKNNARDSRYWVYYVNGAFGQVSVDKQMLKAGDTLTWKY